MPRILLQLRKRPPHRIHDHRHQLMQKRLAQPKLLPAKPHGPPQDSPQHIPASFIARHRPIRQRKRQAADVIRHHPKRDVMPKLRVRRLRLPDRRRWSWEIARHISCPESSVIAIKQRRPQIDRRNCPVCPEAPGRSARTPSPYRHAAPAAASVCPTASRLYWMKTRFQISMTRGSSPLTDLARRFCPACGRCKFPCTARTGRCRPSPRNCLCRNSECDRRQAPQSLSRARPPRYRGECRSSRPPHSSVTCRRDGSSFQTFVSSSHAISMAPRLK